MIQCHAMSDERMPPGRYLSTPLDVGVPEVAMFLREIAEDRREMTAADSTDLVLDPTDRARFLAD